ncbi:MAG: universal stress protein [Myxococcales bacterium]|nr:universal stress protein [Myxococcales bacterium]
MKVDDETNAPIRDILVAVDFSEHANRALDFAIRLARPLGARIHIEHCYMELPTKLLEHNVWIPEGVWDRLKKEDGVRLEGHCERVRAAGIPVELHQSETLPSEAIAARAKQIGADLIVLGTRGMSGLKHALLGSVTERTLRIAPCPVLAVPAPKDGEDD